MEKGIKTLASVAAMLPEVTFICAGKGPLESCLTGKNIINVGFRSEIDLEKLIDYAQFVIVPSEWYEPFGLTIIEAFQLGTPVVGAGIGGILELIQDGENGLIFKVGDREELINKIKTLWNSVDEIKRLSRNCLNTKTISLEEYGKQIMKFYN